MDNQLWTQEEQAILLSLRIDPRKTDRAKLSAVAGHFSRRGTVYGLTESARGDLHVSVAFARKIRDLTIGGRLDWLLHGETPSKAALSVRLGTPRVGFWTDGLSTAKLAIIDVVNKSESEATNCWA